MAVEVVEGVGAQKSMNPLCRGFAQSPENSQQGFVPEYEITNYLSFSGMGVGKKAAKDMYSGRYALSAVKQSTVIVND